MQTGRNGEVSFWYRDVGGVPAPRAALDGDREADVCIVGAGFTGLWTAYYLKKADPTLRIVVLEQTFAGFGASGRNGGWLSPGLGWARGKYLASAGRDAVIALDRALDATVDEVIAVAESEGIDADIRRTDTLTIAYTPAQTARLAERHAEAVAWGATEEQISLMGPEALAARITVANGLGALVTHGSARVQPAKLVRGLAAAVERLGVDIREGTRVLRLEKGVATSDRGAVRAPIIVRATEGFTPSIAGQERRILPLNSAILITEPLSDTQWAQIGWDGFELLGDASHRYSYAQRTREGRIAMGGRGVPYRFGSRTDEGGRTQAATIRALHEKLTTIFPQTAGVAIDHVWCGVLGVPRDWAPSVGLDRANGLAWAGGYVGDGVAPTNLAGRTLADLVLARDTPLARLPWVNHRAPGWEPEPLRWLGVHAMYRLYRWADEHEANGGARTSRWAKLANAITGR